MLKHAGSTLLTLSCTYAGRNHMIHLEYDRRMGPGERELIRENVRLKKLLAEKELANEMLSNALEDGGWK